ncbi:MAG TPA: hypothetical protein VGD56_05920 [Gemmatirosa sp.]
MDIARRVARRARARLGSVTAGARPPRRRAALLVVALVASVVGAAWSATPACACSGGWAPDIYQPYLDLAALVDNDLAERDGRSYSGDDAFAFGFLAPLILADSADATRGDSARRDAAADLQRVWDQRWGWNVTVDLEDTTRPRLTTDALEASLRVGALDRAAADARTLVARSLDMPAAVAQLEQPVVQRAVEYLELRPTLTAAGPPPDGRLLARFFAAPPVPRDTPKVSYQYDSASASRARVRAWHRAQVARVPDPVPVESLPPALREAAALRRMSRAELAAAASRLTSSPRLPSLRFVALEERTRALVPAGWPDTTGPNVAAFRALRRDYDAWRAAYPTHPLADLARFSTVRVDRFASDTARAWATLLAEYPRHPARAATEMYFLLRLGTDPNAATLAAITDPVLRSALVFREFGCETYACGGSTPAAYSRTRWDAAWRRAEAARPAPWAVNAQERLLRVVLGDPTDGALPTAFPTTSESPTALWGAERLAILIRAARWPDAEAQAAVLSSSPAVASMRLRLALRHAQWSRALAEPELDPNARNYILHVLAPDSVLVALAAAPDTAVRHEAVRARAARRASAGDWFGAAHLAASVDTDLARRLGATAPLATNRSSAGRVAYARHLVANQDSLLGGADDRDWYRTVESRWLRLIGDTSIWHGSAPAAIPGVPWTPADERRADSLFLRRNSELYLALGEYAAALRALPLAPADASRRRPLAREADIPYNRLINRNYEYTVFWRRELAHDSDVTAIRHAGRR